MGSTSVAACGSCAGWPSSTFVLLVALVASSLSGNRQSVGVLGPLHGGNFFLLLVIAATAAADGLWGW